MQFTIPNILTFTRLLAAPCVAIFLILDLNAGIALSIFLLASITDYFDGYLARTLNQSTSLGKVLDPIADKAMVIITLCFMNYCFDSTLTRLLFGIPATIIIFREIFVSGLREYAGQQSDLLTVTNLSKWKTALQMVAIGILLAGQIEYLSFLSLNYVGIFILWIASIATAITGIDYFKKSLDDMEG